MAALSLIARAGSPRDLGFATLPTLSRRARPFAKWIAFNSADARCASLSLTRRPQVFRAHCLDFSESSTLSIRHSFAIYFFSASGGEQTDIKPGAAAALTASGPRTLTEQDHVDIVASAVNLLTHQQRVEFLAQMKVP
jgi:hypothetical protein